VRIECVIAVVAGDAAEETSVVSPATAKTHVSRILTKLGLRDRAQLVVAAYEAGLITPGS
jgi:DNA-binding NarL/FixJ family response regulator